MDIEKILNSIVVVGIVWLVICTVSMIFEERPQTDVADSSKLEDEMHEFDRAEYLETAKWGTLEKELEKIGVSDIWYESWSDRVINDELIPADLSDLKILRGRINKKITFEVQERSDTSSYGNCEDNLVFTINGVKINATDRSIELNEDDKLYVSCNGRILLTQNQMDCIKYLKDGGKIKEPHLSYGYDTVEDWLQTKPAEMRVFACAF